ncbi:MAG TPA: lipoprotein-releasing system transmembrane subunit LolC, partial [Rhodospirillales bacterium]|nr:lipoprotein-releasing system transmembrane subunit LolC [Rhodospirillales bacterium]
MFSAFELMMSMRYLRARRQEGFISVIAWFSLLGIALGVATLIIVMSVMNGFRAELLDRILGINGHLSVYSQSDKMTDFDDLAAKIRAVPGVVSVTPIIEGQVMATSKNVASGAIVRGFRKKDLMARSIIADRIEGGSLANFDKDSVVMGARLARKLNLGIGHKVTLISPKGNVT